MTVQIEDPVQGDSSETFEPDVRLAPFYGAAEAFAALLHPYAEVVIHDAAQNRIARIFNAYSGRKIGDPSGIEDWDGLMSGSVINGPFLSKSLDGRDVKYVSTVLRESSGEAVGLMCVNLEVTGLLQLMATGRRFLDVQSSDSFDALFADDWQARIDVFVRQYLEHRLLRLDQLSRAQRIELVASLKDAGAFQAKASAHYVANVLGVSRSTVYNYLARLDGGSPEPSGDS